MTRYEVVVYVVETARDRKPAVEFRGEHMGGWTVDTDAPVRIEDVIRAVADTLPLPLGVVADA